MGGGEGKRKKGEFGLDIKTENVRAYLKQDDTNFFLRLTILARKKVKK
jgi:hypothetical protein